MDSIKKPPTGGFFTFYNYLLSHPPYSLFVIPWLDHGTQVVHSAPPSLVIPWLDHGIQVSQINCLNTAVRCLSIHTTTHRHPDGDRGPLCNPANKKFPSALSLVIPWLDHGIQVSQINCLNTAVRCLSITPIHTIAPMSIGVHCVMPQIKSSPPFPGDPQGGVVRELVFYSYSHLSLRAQRGNPVSYSPNLGSGVKHRNDKVFYIVPPKKIPTNWGIF